MSRGRHVRTPGFLLLSALCVMVLVAAGCAPKRGDGPSPSSGGKFSFERKPSSEILFLSTQMNPVEEAAKMRNAILGDFPGKVDFRPNDNNYLFSQIDVLMRDRPATPILIGALHADLSRLQEEKKLARVDSIMAGLQGRKFLPKLEALARLDEGHLYFVPWMQASYVMVANRKALPSLPKGAKLESLTYAQLLEWGKNLFDRTGKRLIGFPAGDKGLMHRFFQGYLYPSFTGGTLLTFRNADAATMWTYFRDLWSYANPSSISYSTMSDPLVTEDVYIAWDHTARLTKALEQMPGDFVAFPAPLGPKGRGFMPVISGLALPAGSPLTGDQAILIDYLTQPAIQTRTLRETGFFPVLARTEGSDMPPHLKALDEAVTKQAEGSASIPSLLPVGLGERGADFNAMYMLTFSRIVLEGGNIGRTLDANAAELQKILDERNLRCWLPDVSDRRPCRIE